MKKQHEGKWYELMLLYSKSLLKHMNAHGWLGKKAESSVFSSFTHSFSSPSTSLYAGCFGGLFLWCMLYVYVCYENHAIFISWAHISIHCEYKYTCMPFLSGYFTVGCNRFFADVIVTNRFSKASNSAPASHMTPSTCAFSSNLISI